MKSNKLFLLTWSLFLATSLSNIQVIAASTIDPEPPINTLNNGDGVIKKANILKVYYRNARVLFVRNKKTKQVQHDVGVNGVFTFELRSQGGTYEIMINVASGHGKEDNLNGYKYKVLKTIHLGAGQNKKVYL